MLACLCARRLPSRLAAFGVLLLVVPLPSAARAGAWTQPKGDLWVKVAGIYQFAHEFYASQASVLPDGTRIEEGDARPYDDEGVSRQRLLWTEAEYGVTDRLTLGAQVPYYELRFENNFQIIESYGIGDIRFIGRYALLTARNRLSSRVAVKLPTGSFSNEPDRIPIGENQTDLEMGLQYGRSLGRSLSWFGGELNYRFRFRDDELGFDPGDEWFWFAEAGYGLDRHGRVGLKVSYQGARGDDSSVNFFAPGTELSRDFDQIDVVGMFDLGEVFIELGWGHSLRSRSYPTASIWSLGLSRRLALSF